MYSIIQRNKSNLLALIALGVVAALVLDCTLPSPDSSDVVTPELIATPYPGQIWQINESLTIGDFTVELLEIKNTTDGLKISHSHQTSLSKRDYVQISTSEIRYADGSVSRAHRARLPGVGEDIDVSLGVFILADAESSGSVDIPLASVSESGEISPHLDLWVGDRRYAITELTFLEDDSVKIIVRPINPAAEFSTLLIPAPLVPGRATLTDDAGNTYRFLAGGGTSLPFRQTLDSQEIVFDRIPREHLPSITNLTMTVRGVANIVGPFVFENVGLVSEDIPPVTPVPPGGVGPGDPIPTPPNANN